MGMGKGYGIIEQLCVLQGTEFKVNNDEEEEDCIADSYHYSEDMDMNQIEDDVSNNSQVNNIQ